MLAEKRRPLVGEQGAVGLQGVPHPHPCRLFLPDIGGEGPEKVEPRHRRLPALEPEGDFRRASPHVLEGPVDDRLGGAFLHHPVAVGLPVAGHIVVEAVAASHIAQGGGGLY